jgi:hypothetical protein
MREKPYTEIESVKRELIDAVVEQHGGPPDNFVESGEATIVGLPDLDADPDARLLIDGLDARIRELTKENGNGNGSGPDGATAQY